MAVDDAVPELSEMEERVVVADWRGGKGPADRILALGLIHGAGRQANEGGFT
jgi:Fe2+ transport system protein FeoA